MNNGWIKLHRSILNWEWFSNTNTFMVFIHCLFLANYEDKKWQGKIIKRGSFVTSLEHLSIETGLTIQQTRTALSNLQKTNNITKKSTNKYTLITVENYNKYQDDETKKTTNKATDKQQTNNKQPNKRITTTKEYKKKELIHSEPSSQISKTDLAEKLGIPKPQGASYEWQDTAVRYAQKLNIKTNASWFKFFKQNHKQQSKLLRTYQAMVDLPTYPSDPEKYFYKVFWQQ